jgi:hypothetical protein
MRKSFSLGALVAAVVASSLARPQIVVPLKLSHHLAVVVAKIDGKDVPLLFDSGDQSPLGFAAKHPLFCGQFLASANLILNGLLALVFRGVPGVQARTHTLHAVNYVRNSFAYFFNTMRMASRAKYC